MNNQKSDEILDIPPYPICDNCGKSISIFGKYILKRGTIQYVHTYYNEQTEECIEREDRDIES